MLLIDLLSMSQLVSSINCLAEGCMNVKENILL